MDLFADENVPSPMLRRLRQDGWSVIAMSEIAPGEDDVLVAARANTAGLVLLTADRDFGELTFHRGLPVVGVVLLQLERLSLSAQVERVSTFLAAERANLAGSFTVLEPASVRRRVL
jgi:predicted nuclease of predicted toxin-antitoxin system